MIVEDARLALPVSDSDHVQGSAHAVVTLVEYGDFQCPACGMAYPLVKQVQRHYAGNLRFVFRHFPLTQAHPYAQLAAELAEAAAVTGRFWAMHDWLYEHQDEWVPYGAAGLEAGARALGLDEEALAATLRNTAIDARIRRDFMGGVRSGVNGTPSFYVDGYLYQGDFDGLVHGLGRVIARREH
ncbi:MAG: DsbA family protein [Rhodanobacteraceae bacterium]|jgi:protein-disulfide isomerase|nr:DsbA family protein [Rhodanobacteraceae bacterium]